MLRSFVRLSTFPGTKWAVFLHPAQMALGHARLYTGPVRVSGSAGTGKTIVALHRAAHLAKSDPPARILLDYILQRVGERFEEEAGEPCFILIQRVSARITVKAIGAVGHDFSPRISVNLQLSLLRPHQDADRSCSGRDTGA